MNAVRLKRIEEIYHSAADKTGLERDEFLRIECGGDENLCQEVISLLSYDEIADSFIDGTPDDIAAEMFSGEYPSPLIDKTIGHYHIKQLLGVGGMGEVYLADDNLLNRKVALKLVPPDLARNRSHLDRFKQEAKAASALNHPNILTIHEFGVENDVNYIVSEFIDGVTLRHKIAERSLTERKIVDIAIQISSALGAAHEMGIIHRDIKPENIMIRRDGIAKVLDFGLAKLSLPMAVDDEISRQDQTLLKTAPGAIMGTVSYMSPEQARGLKVDGRTDIWSLGIILYEMVTCRRPFAGETQSDVLAAILNRPVPELSGAVINASPEIERIIEKTLAKDVNERYQNIDDLAADLNEARGRLDFEKELQRLRSSSSPARDLRGGELEAATQILPEQNSLSASAGEHRTQWHKARLLGYAAAVAAIVGVVVFVWPVLLPFVSNAPSPAAPAVIQPPVNSSSRTLAYSLTVQSYSDGHYGDPFRLSGEMLFRNRDRIRLNVKSPQAGYLYILNQGPNDDGAEKGLNILFPSPLTNGGSALLAADDNIQIPEQSWFQLDDKEGTELVWIVWSEKPISDLDSAERFANPDDRGRIRDRELERSINSLLNQWKLQKSELERDDDKKETRISGNADIVTHIIKLEHH